MTCTKHPIRRRPDCPDCFPTDKVQTSREALAELDTNCEEEELVIKCERKKKKISPELLAAAEAKLAERKREMLEAKIKPKAPEVEIETKDLTREYISKEVRKALNVFIGETVTDELKAKAKADVEKVFSQALESFMARIRPLSDVQYEHLDIPFDSFNVALMYKLEKEGWCYKDVYRGSCAVASGFKEDTVIMTRVKNSKWPAKPDFKKKRGESK